MNTATGFKTPEIKWEAADLREELANSKQYCDLISSGPRSRKSAKEVTSFIMLSIGRITKNRDIEQLDVGRYRRHRKTRANLVAIQETRGAQVKSEDSQISVIGAKKQE